ncbi:MAG TPA: peptidylprolyl isomerase [Polyangiales bacterium]
MLPTTFLQSRAALVAALITSGGWGCAHGAHNEPGPASAVSAANVVDVAETAPEKTPELIEIRVLLVAYQGARGASAELMRTQPQALERARMISELARGGEHLTELVLTYGDHNTAGDDHGLVRLHPAQPEVFDATVAQAAVALPVGRISAPVALPEGYLVIERLRDPTDGPARISAKHILILYAGSPHRVAAATRTQEQARALAQQIVAHARAPKADFEALAAQYTEEPGGKARAGDLGSFGRGQMVPAFEHAAFALKVGEVSGVVESPFGFHIIKRYE